MKPQFSSFQTTFIFLLPYLVLPVQAGSFVDPYPVSDCSGGIGFGQVTCPNQPGCCSGGATCCAGGCCPLGTTWCVGMGTADEGCCPFDDPTNCGVDVPTFTLPACDGHPKPSVQCVSADDDWYCPPGNVCGTYSGACLDFAADCTTPGAGSGSGGGGPTDGPSPTSAPPFPGNTDTSTSSPVDGGGATSSPKGDSGPTTSPSPFRNEAALESGVFSRVGILAGALFIVGIVAFGM